MQAPKDTKLPTTGGYEGLTKGVLSSDSMWFTLYSHRKNSRHSSYRPTSRIREPLREKPIATEHVDTNSCPSCNPTLAQLSAQAQAVRIWCSFIQTQAEGTELDEGRRK